MTDLVANVEEETGATLCTVAAELESEVSRLDIRLVDRRRSTTNRFITQNHEIGFLSDNLVALTHRVVRLEDGLSQVQTTLDAQSKALTTLGRIQTSINPLLDGFPTALVQAADRLTQLEAAPVQPVPQHPMNPVPLTPVSAFNSSFSVASVANPGHSVYNPPAPNISPHISSFSPVPLPLVMRMNARSPVFTFSATEDLYRRLP